jgi:hypothetical protein
MTANPRPRAEPEELQAFGEELNLAAHRLAGELGITRVELSYQPPVEAHDVPRAVIEVWVDGGHHAALDAERRLNGEARTLEQRSGLPWRTAAIIPHWRA